ncbi:hypothetical protein LAV82_22920 [Bacillus sp. ILBB4]|nr:hypothetical protein [Bacillus sp. ILBB4]
MRMPTSKSGGARFRGPTSSQEYNTNEDQKYLEMIELYKQNNSTQLSLEETNEIIVAENNALNYYVRMLESRMATLEAKLTSLGTNYANGRFFKTSFVQKMSAQYPRSFQDQSVSTPRCEIDRQHRYVTPPKIHEIPKTHLIDESGNVIIPSELKVQVGRTSTKGTVKDNNILNAFNGDNLSFWHRTVTYDSLADVPANGEDVILEIELPTHLVNNLNINTILVHPHPERGIQIKNIEVQYNSGWQTINGFNQNEISTITSVGYSPRRKWFFPSVPVQKLRVTLVQKNSASINGKTVFTLGAQEIGVYLTMFEPSGGMILTPFDMDSLYNIESVEHVFLNRSAFSFPSNLDHMLENNLFEYEVYVEEADQTLRPIQSSEWTSQTAKRIWVKTQLYPDPNNGVNPCLHAVRLHYTKV